MYINKIAVVLIIKDVTPDMFIKLSAGQNFIPVQNKIRKEVKFLFGKINLITSAYQFP